MTLVPTFKTKRLILKQLEGSHADAYLLKLDRKSKVEVGGPDSIKARGGRELLLSLVEVRGVEPLTSAMPLQRSTN